MLWRGQRLRALAAVDELVAAKPDGERGWHLAVIRHGQLAAAGVRAPRSAADAGRGRADARRTGGAARPRAPLGGALVEETALIARWLAQPGVRIVRAEPGYCSPVGAAGRWAAVGGVGPLGAPGRRAQLATELALRAAG